MELLLIAMGLLTLTFLGIEIANRKRMKEIAVRELKKEEEVRTRWVNTQVLKENKRLAGKSTRAPVKTVSLDDVSKARRTKDGDDLATTLIAMHVINTSNDTTSYSDNSSYSSSDCSSSSYDSSSSCDYSSGGCDSGSGSSGCDF